jgi:hypothetical protein
MRDGAGGMPQVEGDYDEGIWRMSVYSRTQTQN